MKTTSSLILSLALASGSAFASEGWYGKAGAMTIGDSDGDLSIDLTGIYLGVGYEIEMGNGFYVAPEARLATGVDGDDLFGVDVDLDTAWFAGARALYRAENGFYLFAVLGYGEISLDASMGDVSESASADDIGFGGGIGYAFSDKFEIEVSLEDFDGSDLIQLGSNFRF